MLMLILTPRFLPFLLFLLSTAAAQNPNPPPYTPTDLILLNCGASSRAASLDGRNWDADAQSKFIASNSRTASSVFTASKQDPSVAQVPYMIARVIHSKFTYTFPISPGPKFLRLYFYPTSYSDFNTSTSFFTLTANSYTLLRNFSAYLTASAPRPNPTAYLVKEFIIPVRDMEELNIIFTPSPSSFAFINGIEIVSMPNNLYSTRAIDDPYHSVNGDGLFFFDNTTSFETIFRLNVGGAMVSSIHDTGMFRQWLDDTDFIFGAAAGIVHVGSDAKIVYTDDTPPYFAPTILYQTKRSMGPNPDINLNYNLTWQISVDSGFFYLVRLHFCETEKFVNGTNQRVFFIFINNMTAEYEADVIHWAGGIDIPVHRDYIVWVPSGNENKQDLWLALHPNVESSPRFADAVLNGLEILKLNTTDGNLAGQNPAHERDPTTETQHPSAQERTKGKRSSIPLIAAIAGAVVGAVFAFSFFLWSFLSKQKRQSKDFGKSITVKSSWDPIPHASRSTTTSARSPLPTDICRRFTIIELKAATSNFDDQNVIGYGGFGDVYKGYIDCGSIPVAVKRLNSSSNQGSHEFHTEIEMLSKLRHLHLVSLIGYCDDQGEMILVYEYMSRGTLRDHLYGSKTSPIPWKQRLEICIGAAKGLNYLHSGAKHTIIHRDVKSTNILLDENWVAKVSDFGLSKIGPTSVSQTHVSTVVKGSFGYMDPEYVRRQVLTEKSDVYSFGVVLFEVLCGRPPLIPSLPREQANLAAWAKTSYVGGTLHQIMDPDLRGDVAPLSLNKFGEIACWCLHDQGAQRPNMGDVVWGVEFALQLQRTAEKNVSVGDGDNMVWRSPLLPCGEVITTDDDLFSGSGERLLHSMSTVSKRDGSGSQSDPDGMKPECVFTEIRTPQGR